MKSKYLIITIFVILIFNKIHSIACSDIQKKLEELLSNHDYVELLDNISQKVVFFIINETIYAIKDNINTYYFFGKCSGEKLYFYDINNNTVVHKFPLNSGVANIYRWVIDLKNTKID
jgi:hypothetical protein